MPDPSFQDGCDPLRAPAVRAWFQSEFPAGPTPAQALAWPAIDAGENVLLVSPTGDPIMEFNNVSSQWAEFNEHVENAMWLPAGYFDHVPRCAGTS